MYNCITNIDVDELKHPCPHGFIMKLSLGEIPQYTMCIIDYVMLVQPWWTSTTANVYELTVMESCHMLLLMQGTALLVKCLMARIASHAQWDSTRMRRIRQNASLVAVR